MPSRKACMDVVKADSEKSCTVKNATNSEQNAA